MECRRKGETGAGSGSTGDAVKEGCDVRIRCTPSTRARTKSVNGDILCPRVGRCRRLESESVSMLRAPGSSRARTLSALKPPGWARLVCASVAVARAMGSRWGRLDLRATVDS
jgi:hypothetical protein